MAKIEAVEFAKKIGTYNAPDRSRQYPLDTVDDIVEAMHKSWVKIHQLEAANKELVSGDLRKDKEIKELKEALAESKKLTLSYRIKYGVTISIITGLAWEGLKQIFSLIR